MKLATLVYVKRGGQTLIIQRVKKERDIHEDKSNGLGGKLESGESPKAHAPKYGNLSPEFPESHKVPCSFVTAHLP